MRRSETLRICLISPARWRYTKRLMEELCALDQIVFLLVDKRKKSGLRNAKSPNCFTKELWKQNARLPWYVIRIPLEIVETRPNIVHIQFEYLVFGRLFVSSFFPILLLLLKLVRKIENFKILLTMHSVVPLDKVSSFERMILRPYTRLGVKLSDMVIVHTELAKVALVKTYGVNEKKIVIIPHGMETKFPPADGARIVEELSLKGKKVILHFGIIRASKGLDTLLRAFREVASENQNVALVIAGWFHEYLTDDEMKKIFRFEGNDALRARVRILIGFLPEDRLYEIISASDVICLPYTENHVIGVSGATADIVMCGKPIVVTRCLKFLQFKEFSNVTFTQDDDKSLAKTLLRALQTTQDVTPSIQQLKRYSWRTVAEKTLTYYRTILSGGDQAK